MAPFLTGSWCLSLRRQTEGETHFQETEENREVPWLLPSPNYAGSRGCPSGRPRTDGRFCDGTEAGLEEKKQESSCSLDLLYLR
ncbi:hypothetical protein VTK26DRAFT_9184 [Humicola hyalothermophila]